MEEHRDPKEELRPKEEPQEEPSEYLFMQETIKRIAEESEKDFLKWQVLVWYLGCAPVSVSLR